MNYYYEIKDLDTKKVIQEFELAGALPSDPVAQEKLIKAELVSAHCRSSINLDWQQSPTLLAWINKYNLPIRVAPLFVSAPEFLTIYHRDGHNILCAVNIPWVGCPDTLTEWNSTFAMEEEVDLHADGNQIRIRGVTEPPPPADAVHILSKNPVAFNTDIHHRVDSRTSKKVRALISLRFTLGWSFQSLLSALNVNTDAPLIGVFPSTSGICKALADAHTARGDNVYGASRANGEHIEHPSTWPMFSGAQRIYMGIVGTQGNIVNRQKVSTINVLEYLELCAKRQVNSTEFVILTSELGTISEKLNRPHLWYSVHKAGLNIGIKILANTYPQHRWLLLAPGRVQTQLLAKNEHQFAATPEEIAPKLLRVIDTWSKGTEQFGARNQEGENIL